ncbi:MAG: Tim44/TimA family putative adaptor protein, partial [Alphaproteobacteria bacterium]|nr:Tim44/TimA family putative adaptor protein [Alphaproteobacteria bacterium]
MGSEIIEVFVWAGIATVMVYLLYSVLGKKEGFEDKEKWSRYSKRFETKEEEGDLNDAVKDTVFEIIPNQPDGSAERLNKLDRRCYEKIKGIDPAFNLDTFLKGAEVAFSMVVESYAVGDLETLKMVLSDALFAEFEEDVKQREALGERAETKVLKINKMEITKLELLGTQVRINVDIESEQFHLVRDQTGTLIEGSENQTET